MKKIILTSSETNHPVKLNSELALQFLLFAACFISIISQMSIFIKLDISHYLNMPIWIILFIFCCITKKINKTNSLMIISILSFFIIINILFETILFNKKYLESSILRSFLISVFFFLTGNMIGRKNIHDTIKTIGNAYVISTFIVSIEIYFNYFLEGVQTLNNVQYVYDSKNSFSQIIFSAVLIIWLSESNNTRLGKILKYLFTFFEIYLILLMRSRATILGILLCTIYILFGKKVEKKLKYIIIAAMIILITFLILNNNFYDLIINKVILGGRTGRGINEISSGRLDILKSFRYLIRDNWIYGIGSYYYECLPLSSILQFGLLTGLLIDFIAFYPIIHTFIINKKINDSNLKLFIAICILYTSNCLFEGLAPFGPGVKCFLVWLLLGIFSY